MSRAAHENNWHFDAIHYEVPVRSFYDASGDGTGDFRGLTAQLDHIQELGATCIWLLPFMASPLRDDGYDVSDYRALHPAYGTIDDFQAFIAEAHRRGLRVAAEMTINHTSDQHPWFQAARYAPRESSARHYYHWNDSANAFAGADVLYRDAKASNWSWDPQASAFYWHRFYHHQPDLNYGHAEVREEMLKVLRFWADQGVDALGLNGAAYLAEEEGTRCEHLPQTHELLSYFRSELGGSYPELVLQAGVNATPKQAATYFGNGNECQVVPQTALAQRLFLALRQEVARPLESLLEQTPRPPAQCQWMTLLRNHDELTLSLVTDEERDYLLKEYAHDPTMRRHAGIARRLGPLLENNQRLLELAFSLMLSLPGAPLIYYGDEIGMGDNVFLPGRAGIRTPMQWNADRNAGFSAADTSRLYCPLVDDPVFGYRAINVESQLRNRNSQFHLVRRLIARRKNSVALSRGDLELVPSNNAKVLAFVRRTPEEAVLVVANLARTPQPVELDLSAFAGLIPVEMQGHTPFRQIDRAPYSLNLAQHGVLWFNLQKTFKEVAPRLAPVETENVTALPTIEVATIEELFEGAARERFQRDVLPGYLKSQRWFGGKARQVQAVRVLDWGPLPGQQAAYLALISVEFAGGTRDTYFLPVGFTETPAAAQIYETRRSHVIAGMSLAGREGLLFDALVQESFAHELLSLLGAGGSFAMRSGTIHLQPTTAFEPLRGNVEDRLRAHSGPPTSSNSLLFYGRRLLLKLFRRLEPGINPDVEIGRFLTEVAHFDRIPQVAGSWEYLPREASAPLMLGILQALVPNQGDGWQHAVDELSRYYERASARMYAPDAITPDSRPLTTLAKETPPLTILETIGAYMHSAAILGQRTAQMHQAVATSQDNPDFAPEPFAEHDRQRLLHDLHEQAERAINTLRDNLHHVRSEDRDAANQLLEQGPAAIEQLSNAFPERVDAMKIRIHGDYHLGQVLWVDNDYYLIDFEGEPARSVPERRQKYSAVRDVAGMLRSYHYAAYAGLFAFTAHRPQDFQRLIPWAEAWHQWVSAAFLRAYLDTAKSAAFVPHDQQTFGALLSNLMLSKAFYELSYELNNRPDWVRIPLGGVQALLQPAVSRPLELDGV